MSIYLAALLFAVGVVLIIKGGDVFVDAAGWVSDVSGLSKAVIGATVVSLATTAPEYFVSTIAVLKGSNDLSVGNAVGSLMCNIGIAFAVLAFFSPGKIKDKRFTIKGLFMILSAVLLWIFCTSGVISVAEGVVLLVVFLVFTAVNIWDKGEAGNQKPMETSPQDIALNTAKFILGAAAIVAGSNFVVENGRFIAAFLGVSEAIIGLTMVAVGTSLPEITTSVAAIIKKQSSLSIGNIIGANILDATLILSTGAFISAGGLSVSLSTVKWDLPFTILVMATAVLPSTLGKKIYRWQGALLLLMYLFYLVMRLVIHP